MPRLLIHVEGQTEETVVNELIGPHLVRHGYDSVGARLLGGAQLRARRGGARAWSAVRRDILRHLKSDDGLVVSTLVDYYGLPASGDRAWPGRAGDAAATALDRATRVEAAMLEDVTTEMGSPFAARRFVPFVVLHEFEGLLFSDCAAFARGIGRQDLAPAFQQIRDRFATPEEINDAPATAPSKRVAALIPSYDKPFLRTLAMLEIGLGAVRDTCPHFGRWLGRLEIEAGR